MERSNGVLMAVSSLPSPYGIGTLGKAAYDFVDFLEEADQKVWQMLPLGPTSYGDSPYSSFSTFAGNPYFVDLDVLCEEGLLTAEELRAIPWGDDASRVDYGAVYSARFDVLAEACRRGWGRDREAIEAFAAEQSGWLDNYTLFMALKRRYGMSAWTEWPDEAVRLREPAALARCREELAEDIRLFTFIQYHFFRQWNALRDYAREKGVQLMGDVPIYVALDSADVWAEPGNFRLNEENVPTEVAGVPPDYFNADGQLWGNPLYDWDAMAADGYNWWIRRMEGARRLYDIVRIDHFRGFESYWCVPYGDKTARNGRWAKGPGLAFVSVLRDGFSDLQIVAEDLGYATDEVRSMLAGSGFPGMKVLEFAFDPSGLSEHIPHAFTGRCVCYIGTHDNVTLREWLETAPEEDLAFAREYLGVGEGEDLHWSILRCGMASTAELFVAQMQDLLELGVGTRMNTPGTDAGNWSWRMLPDAIRPEVTARLRRMTEIYGRGRPAEPEEQPAGETEE